MLALKTWLETTGLTVGEVKFRKPPALPYIVFDSIESISGADDTNLLITRDVTVELYSENIDLTSEKAITDLLDAKALSYQKKREWIASEGFFQITYDLVITERK